MLILCYIDDSADQSKSIVAVAGAFLGDAAQWAKLSKPWRERVLAEGASYYRSTALRNWRRPFFFYRDRTRFSTDEEARTAEASLRSDLHQIIRDSGVMGVAHYIPLDIYKGVRANVPMAAKVFPKDAFEVAMQSLIRDCALEFKRHFGDRHELAFICDDGPSAHLILDTYRGFKRVHPQFSELIGSLSFEDDKRFPELQAADLMADYARKIAMDAIENPSIKHEGPINSNIYFVRHWNEKIMLDTLEYNLRTAHERLTP